MSREARTAKTNQTGTFECFQKILVVVHNRWLHLFGNLLFAVRCNYDYLIDCTDAGCHRSNPFNGTGHTGMSSCAHERLRRTNELSDLHGIPFFTSGSQGAPICMCKRYTPLSGTGTPDLWNTVICVLMVWNMQPGNVFLPLLDTILAPISIICLSSFRNRRYQFPPISDTVSL